MLTQHLGSGGSLAVLAVLVGFAVRLLRTGQANALLTRLGLRGVPTHLLPWAALVLGAVGQVLDAYLGGGLDSAKAAGLAALDGVLAGALAIAGHESIVKAPERARALKPADAPQPEKQEEPPPVVTDQVEPPKDPPGAQV